MNYFAKKRQRESSFIVNNQQTGARNLFKFRKCINLTEETAQGIFNFLDSQDIKV